ncbi:hypothetical protein WA026_010477 [Henosepilachna vigintioctopunctata]|uniref:Uncharacterized protein n=1 Tax=Henosepilachna vigintioctopunctata TaxID=420089 RepID=A0AAW1V9X6_9CUCU
MEDKEGDSSSESPTISELVSPECNRAFEGTIVPTQVVVFSGIDENKGDNVADSDNRATHQSKGKAKFSEKVIVPSNVELVYAEVHPIPRHITRIQSANDVPPRFVKPQDEQPFDLYKDPKPSTSKSAYEPLSCHSAGPSGDYPGRLSEELMFYKTHLKQSGELQPVRLNFDELISQKGSVSSFEDLKSEPHETEDKRSMQLSYSPSSIVESVSSMPEGLCWVQSDKELKTVSVTCTPDAGDLTVPFYQDGTNGSNSPTAASEPWVGPTTEMAPVELECYVDVPESEEVHETRDTIYGNAGGEPWVCSTMELATVPPPYSDDENADQMLENQDPISPGSSRQLYHPQTSRRAKKPLASSRCFGKIRKRSDSMSWPGIRGRCRHNLPKKYIYSQLSRKAEPWMRLPLASTSVSLSYPNLGPDSQRSNMGPESAGAVEDKGELVSVDLNEDPEPWMSTTRAVTSVSRNEFYQFSDESSGVLDPNGPADFDTEMELLMASNLETSGSAKDFSPESSRTYIVKNKDAGGIAISAQLSLSLKIRAVYGRQDVYLALMT